GPFAPSMQLLSRKRHCGSLSSAEQESGAPPVLVGQCSTPRGSVQHSIEPSLKSRSDATSTSLQNGEIPGIGEGWNSSRHTSLPAMVAQLPVTAGFCVQV